MLRNYAQTISDGNSREYADAYAQALADGKKESYAKNYARAVADEKSEKYAQSYANKLEYSDVSDAYAHNYAQAISDGNSREYADAYASAIDGGKSVSEAKKAVADFIERGLRQAITDLDIKSADALLVSFLMRTQDSSYVQAVKALKTYSNVTKTIE